MSSRTVVYLVRHAQSQPSSDVPEPEWPLSEAGRAQAEALVAAMLPLGIDALYSSPYPRAADTLRPLARALGQPVSICEPVHERVLSRSSLPDDWSSILEKYWDDPDFALPDGESNRACAQRVVPAIAQLAHRHSGQTLAIASHGNAIALYLGSFHPSFGFEQWRAMRNPDLFRVVYEVGQPAWDGVSLATSIGAADTREVAR